MTLKPESAKWIHDIREAVLDIQNFTDGMDFERYCEDPKTRAAVERKFEIIGESCMRLRERDPSSSIRSQNPDETCISIFGYSAG